jgi:endosialidase-like protein
LHRVAIEIDDSGFLVVSGCSSDARLKHDITPLADGALDKIMRPRPVDFVWNDDASSRLRAGFIAQETMLHIPEAVEANNPLGNGYYLFDGKRCSLTR